MPPPWWAEYSPRLNSLKVFAHSLFDVSCDGGKMNLCFPDSAQILLPVHSLNPEWSSVQTVVSDLGSTGSLYLCSIHGATVDCPVEDWFKWSSVTCRDCGFELLSSASGVRPCLMPSATWGFEDMRVCEECGPLVVDSGSHKKRNVHKDIFLIDQFNLWVASDQSFCACIEDRLQEDQNELIRVAQSVPQWHHMRIRKIPKQLIKGLPVLDLYGEDLELFSQWEESSAPLVRPIAKDVVLIRPGREEYSGPSVVIQPAIRVLYKTDQEVTEEGVEEAENTHQNPLLRELLKRSLPASLSPRKGWRISTLPLAPSLVDF